MIIAFKTIRNILVILTFSCFVFTAYAQQQVTIMTYNLLKFSENSADRLPCFKTILDSLQPDILVVQEIFSQNAISLFHSNALNTTYQQGIFIDGPDSDNGLFYKRDRFTFISNTPIPTALRNISEFKLVYNETGDTLRVYSVHLKASSGSVSESQRLEEINALREVTNSLVSGSNFIVCGDFNIYKSSEPAYQALIYADDIAGGYFIDPLAMTGTWNKPEYAAFHTQSPRKRQFGGGASGGLDDRFDMILFSQAIADPGGMQYIQHSTWAVGNDGHHYNDSVNRPPNTSVSQSLADALHCASDHLPLIARFFFGVTLTNVSISLHEGWNSVSAHVEPVNNSIELMMAPLAEKFIAIQHLDGTYYPDGGTYTIEEWDWKKGYAIKVSDASTLVIQGFLPQSATLQINEGWNLIPVISDTPQEIGVLFGENLSFVEIITQVAGVKVYWPAKEIYEIEFLQPKAAYYLKSCQSFVVDF